jgi:hypothetical protein
MSFLPANSTDPFVFDYGAVRDLGKDFASRYASGDPFPHIVIDDFLPEAVIEYVLANFPSALDPDGQEYNRDQERFKRSYHPDYLPPRLRQLFYAFNARPFIKVVENITGIKGLIPDPYFLGAGFHEIRTGGHLSMHADFNHHAPLDLERRVNLLVYLNQDWKAEYGGQLELWTTDMQRQVHSIVPVLNRCVLFTTTQQSMHGNPQPIAHPQGISRKSIALYYYTSTWRDDVVSKTTQFKPRPGTEDTRDWTLKTDEILREFLPPVIGRFARGLNRGLHRRLRKSRRTDNEA